MCLHIYIYIYTNANIYKYKCIERDRDKENDKANVIKSQNFENLKGIQEFFALLL